MARRKGQRRKTLADTISRATDRNVELIEEVGNVAQAWTAASSDFWSGYARVMGNFAENVADDMLGRRDDDEDGDDEDDDSTPLEAGVRRVRDVNRSAVECAKDSATVLARSLDRFNEVYDSNTNGDAEEAPVESDEE